MISHATVIDHYLVEVVDAHTDTKGVPQDMTCQITLGRFTSPLQTLLDTGYLYGPFGEPHLVSQSVIGQIVAYVESL